jgi:DUF1680 family protein
MKINFIIKQGRDMKIIKLFQHDSVVRMGLAMLIFLCQCQKGQKMEYPITPVSFTQVHLTDHFWSKRIETNRSVTIPFGLNKCEEEGRIRNFARAGGLLEGPYEGKMPFDDSDVYKVIEGASYSLLTHPDPELDARLDTIIDKIAAAQEKDGYLCTWKTLNPDTTPAPWVKPGPRWYNLGASHELYNAGHLYEAAFAHAQATGKRNLLNIALKNADLMLRTFGPGKIMTPPGHQIIETGLIKLYRISGKRAYLDLAKFFLDQRGNAAGHELYGPYSQDHIPVIRQEEAVGHAVRAVYMYAAMADIAAIMHDSDYLQASDRLWENVTAKKIYITGGIGARHRGEAFGEAYELPNLTAYNETCAAIGNIYWNHRMFLLHGDAKYMDVLEQTLYNGMISGVGMSGDLFFYPNCLESDGKYLFNQGQATRQPWFDCSCCPTNVIRFIPSVPGYIYACQKDTLFINLFIASTARVPLNSVRVQVNQETDYPWDGRVTIRLEPEIETRFAVRVRQPGWTSDRTFHNDLYRFLEPAGEIQMRVNEETVPVDLVNGYACIERVWKSGDTIEMELPMAVRRVIANDKVSDDRNKVALTRGPLVYCAEWPDHSRSVFDLLIPDSSGLRAEPRPELLGGVMVLQGDIIDRDGGQTKLCAIPYYAWSHRGPGEMAVWMGRK